MGIHVVLRTYPGSVHAEFDAAGKAADFGVLSSFLALARERIDYGDGGGTAGDQRRSRARGGANRLSAVFGATVSITFLTPELFASTARIYSRRAQMRLPG